MKKGPAVSVIIATYNFLNYLQLCLLTLERQRFRDFEVIVADDGSGPQVGQWLAGYRPGFEVRHLWQEDKGFRKCRILNQAVLQARAPYLVFLDADCLLACDFIQQHWLYREPGRFLGGRRVMIARRLAETVTPEMVRRGTFDGFCWWAFRHVFSGEVRYFEESLPWLHRWRPSHPFSLLGCNFSLFRQDLLRVNGFDEDYESRGGGEDTDIAVRLNLAGIRMKSVRYRAIQYHLGHEKSEPKSASEKLFRAKTEKLKTARDAASINSAIRTDGGGERS